jgi:hypothetical protein
MDRDTGSAIAAAGFAIADLDAFRFQGLTHVLGVARAPAG